MRPYDLGMKGMTPPPVAPFPARPSTGPMVWVEGTGLIPEVEPETVLNLKVNGSRGVLDVIDRKVYNRYGYVAQFPHEINWDHVDEFMERYGKNHSWFEGTRWLDVEVMNKSPLWRGKIVILDVPERKTSFLRSREVISNLCDRKVALDLEIEIKEFFEKEELPWHDYGADTVDILPRQISGLDSILGLPTFMTGYPSRIAEYWKRGKAMAKAINNMEGNWTAHHLSRSIGEKSNEPVLEGFVGVSNDAYPMQIHTENKKTPGWTKWRWSY